ncbi:efflux transporter outer membrane subunit [Methylomarinum sp. Ch1-1]|uniref:Efflux transporter outer membrane subunit n=1 Tax=Methylomarinum roseum TaxID=3067653 RepID=A0AAU7NY41_9GAMM|nr:efflux transporter outer membrane subunit [Methylomarinum sp. Ch1-1]MDP4522008.1 efflux transporter outer membrane subunit [Methylomarinum sp. Ch1-1]
MKRFQTTLFCLALLALQACMVGPDYQEPHLELPAQWMTPLTADGGRQTRGDVENWWRVFNDPILTALITMAEIDNRDVYRAEARVLEARARRKLAGAELLPTTSMSMAASRTETESALRGINTELYNHTLDASWELDLFGKKRRTLEAAEASEEAQQEDLHDVLVSLYAEVALNYVDVRSYQTRLSITESNLAAQTETYQLTQWRQQAGLTTQLDVEQARLTLENTRAELPSLKSSLGQAKHNLALLVGREPVALTAILAARGDIPLASADVAVGIPADLLRRRPDLRRAERQLAAQTAQIGVAEGERYPDLTLSGSIGLKSLEYASLYSAGARASEIAARTVLTLLDFGRISSNVAIQKALREQALGLYQQPHCATSKTR